MIVRRKDNVPSFTEMLKLFEDEETKLAFQLIWNDTLDYDELIRMLYNPKEISGLLRRWERKEQIVEILQSNIQKIKELVLDKCYTIVDEENPDEITIIEE